MSGSAADLAYGDIALGAVFEVERTFTAEDVLAFARLCGDFSPLHVDADYAAHTEFGRCVVHGMLLGALFSQIVGMQAPGRRALYLGQELTFRRPVFVGERVHATAKVTGKNDATRVLILQTEVRGTDDRVVASGAARVKVRDSTSAPAVDRPASRTIEPRTAGAPRVALVTGGSRGIGAEIVRVLASRGWAVAINYWRSGNAADALAHELERAGGRALPLQADVRDPASVDSLIAQSRQHLGVPVLLVNAATGDLEHVAAADISWDAFERHLAYQAKAVLQLCQAVRPGMLDAGGGAIINIASQVTTDVPPTNAADYITAKYALLGLSRALASEWATDNIRVNLVSPSLVRTELTQNYQERVFKLEAARTPLRRLATPHDVAAAVAWLASDEAAFLTGVNVPVTGGQTML
jgi:3-oxoacyl-[acyl-carrier protein] reductase